MRHRSLLLSLAQTVVSPDLSSKAAAKHVKMQAIDFVLCYAHDRLVCRRSRPVISRMQCVLGRQTPCRMTPKRRYRSASLASKEPILRHTSPIKIFYLRRSHDEMLDLEWLQMVLFVDSSINNPILGWDKSGADRQPVKLTARLASCSTIGSTHSVLEVRHIRPQSDLRLADPLRASGADCS